MTSMQAGQTGHALVEFSLHGVFPEDDVSSTRMVVDHLAPALESLAAAKSQLEVRLLNTPVVCV
jgi:protein transport protein DSL1/ZW10